MLSIVTPILNGEQFVEKNIESINKLSIPYEHIFVDGGSTDGTLDILNKYSNEITILNQDKRRGMYGAIDQGIRESSGKLVTYINCDDWIIKEGYESMYECSVNTDADLTYSSGQFYFLEDDKYVPFKAKRNARYFLKNGFMPFIQPCTIYKKSTYLEVEGFDYNKFRHFGDLDFFQKIAYLENSKISFVNECSVSFLKYDGSFGAREIDIKFEERNHLRKYNKSILNRVLFQLS